MPLQTVQIGPFSALYVGLTGQASALTQVNSVRTNGADLSENLPSEYQVSIDAPIQVGNHTASVTLEFLGTADETTCLVKGLPLGSDVNSYMAQSQYALLLVTGAGSDNYYFPKVRTERTYRRSYNKRAATTTAIVFTAEKRDVTTPIIYKGTLTYLQGIMSSQYPL